MGFRIEETPEPCPECGTEMPDVQVIVLPDDHPLAAGTSRYWAGQHCPACHLNLVCSFDDGEFRDFVAAGGEVRGV